MDGQLGLAVMADGVGGGGIGQNWVGVCQKKSGGNLVGSRQAAGSSGGAELRWEKGCDGWIGVEVLHFVARLRAFGAALIAI